MLNYKVSFDGPQEFIDQEEKVREILDNAGSGVPIWTPTMPPLVILNEFDNKTTIEELKALSGTKVEELQD